MGLDQQRIQKPARKLRKFLKKVNSAPVPEDVHRFRTNARRLETVLETFSLDNTKNGRQVARQIAKLRRRAGKVRDFDVLTDYVSAIPHDHSEAECSVRLLEYLGGQRAKQARKFQNLEQRYSSSLRRSLKRAWKTIDEIFPPKGDGQVKGKSLPAIVSASALTLLSELTRPSQLRKSNLHEYRLKVKELRNLFQMAQNSDQQPFVDELGDVKDAIGEWHDWEVLVAIANNVLDHGKDCRLVANLRKTTENKYQHALRLAQDMRRQDLRLSKPHANHSSKARPFQPAKRVWSATASLAA